jgi:hypothetical protein
MSESIVNTKVQDALVDVINKSVTAFEQGASFLAAELPDVVYQLLLWHAVKSAVFCVIGIFLLVLMVVILVKYSGKGAETEENEYHRMKYKWTLTHDDDGDVGPHVIVLGVVCILLTFISFALINMTWLQIMIAPKIFLIEYAANLLK